jgi:N-dimethylarginine dimethylaminohydrolase
MTPLNQLLIMSDTAHFSNLQQINPYYHQESIDPIRASEEHQEIYRSFIDAGIRVIRANSPIGSQDGVYTANWALVRGKKAVMSRLPDARKSEEAHAKNFLQQLGIETIEVPSGHHFSGQGDALACGDLLLAGQGYRSAPEAQQFAADTLGYRLVQLQTVPKLDEHLMPTINKSTGWPESYFYDIDLALAVIKAPRDGANGLIAYCPEAFDEASIAKIEQLENIDKITIDLDEAMYGFAANLVSTGEKVIMSARAPKLAAKLAQLGLEIITPNITELSKGGGYIRCVSLTIGA